MHEYISSFKLKPINCEYLKKIKKLIIQYFFEYLLGIVFLF